MGLVSSPLTQTCHSVAVPFSVQLRSIELRVTLATVRLVGVGQDDCPMVVKLAVLLQELEPREPQLFATRT